MTCICGHEIKYHATNMTNAPCIFITKGVSIKQFAFQPFLREREREFFCDCIRFRAEEAGK